MAFVPVVSGSYQNSANRNINGHHHHHHHNHQHVTSATVAAVATTSATTSPSAIPGKLSNHIPAAGLVAPASIISKVQSVSDPNRHSDKNGQVMSVQLPTAAASIPPIAHAIGGSIGSTISTLLLYPLERSRIEMQTQAAIQHEFERKKKEIETVQDLFQQQQEEEEKKMKKKKLPRNNLHDEIFDNDGSEQDSFSTSDGDSTGYFSYNIVDGSSDKYSPSSMDPSLRFSSSSPSSTTLSLPPYPTWKKDDTIMHPWFLPTVLLKKSSLIRTIHRLHLQKRLYKGCTPMAVTMALSNFIFFYALQTLKKMMKQKNVSLLTSSIAGIINVLLTNPLWVANLRLVQEPSSLPHCHDIEDNHDDPSIETSTTSSKQQSITRYRGLIHSLKEICRKEGIRQLWAGTGASLLLVSNPAIQYYIYEKCKMTLLEKDVHRLTPRNSLKPLEAFLIGALAKGFATIATYPLQLAQVLMRLQTNNREHEKDEHEYEHEHKDNNHGDDKSDRSKEEEMMSHTTKTRYSSLLDCMFKLYKGGGVKALYSGINAKLMQTVLSSALTFLTYEQILNLVAKSYWWVLSKRLVNNRTAT